MADNKDKVKRAGIFTQGGMEGDTRVLFTTTNTYNGDKRTAEQKEDHTRLIKQLGDNIDVLNKAPDSSLNTWKRVDPGATFGMNPQRTIENMMKVTPGQDVFWFDMENVGTFNGTKDDNLKWYSPTEIAIRKSKVNLDGTMSKSSKHMSLLIKPNEDVFKRMNELVAKVENNGRTWRGKLTDDERRTLNDLILYGDSDPVKNGFFKTHGDTEKSKRALTFVQRQNRAGQALNGSIFTPDHIKQMRQGLLNLNRYGTEAEGVASAMLSIFKGSTNYMLGGFNIQNYDIPMVNDWMRNDIFGRLEHGSPMQKQFGTLMQNIAQTPDIDVRQATNVLWKDFGSRIARLSNAGVLPKDLKQETIAQMLGIKTGTAHMGIDDVDTVIKIHNYLTRKEGLMEQYNGGGGFDRMRATWDTTALNTGDKLYSMSGLTTNKDNPNDAVYQQVEEIDPKTGKKVKKMELAYGRQMAPLWSNNEYSIVKQYDGVELNGKKQYGMMLKNEDTGLFHVITRDTKHEFQNVLQQTMMSSEDVFGKGTMAREKRRDQARRTYAKLFSNESGGGRVNLDRYLAGLDALEEGNALVKAGKMKKSELGAFVANYNKNGKTTMTSYKDAVTGEQKMRPATDAFFRDLTTMSGRLRSERTYIEQFLNELDRRMPLAKGKRYSGGHNMALQQFRREMDAHFGPNLTPLRIYEQRGGGRNRLMTGHGSLPFQMEGNQVNIRLKDKKTIENDIRRMIYQGHNGAPTIGIQQKRLQSLLVQARMKGPSGLTQLEYNDILQDIRGLNSEDKATNVISKLAAHMDAQFKYNTAGGWVKGDMGINTIEVDDPTGVNPVRAKAMDLSWNHVGADIIDRSIADGKVQEARFWDGKMNFADPQLKKVMGAHNKSLDSLMKKIGAKGKNGNLAYYSAEETLTSLINSFNADGYKAALVYDAKNKGMVMALAHEDIAQQVFGLQGNEILKHNKVATIAIPMLDGKGNIVMPGQERIGRIKAFEDRNGSVKMGTAFEEAIRALRFRASATRTMMNEGKIFEAEKMLKGALRESVQNLSLNNKYMSDADIAQYDERKSRASKWIRSSAVDVTEFAGQWYGSFYQDRDIRKKRDRMAKERISFFQTLNQDEQRAFHQNIGSWLRNEKGLDVNFHNVKDTHAANGLRSTNDVRSLYGFGYYNGMARENLMKSVNYAPLATDAREKEVLEAMLKNGGKLDTDKINRMMNRRFMTDKAIEVLGDEVSFLNVRSAYMDNKQLTNLLTDKSNKKLQDYIKSSGMTEKEIARLSTYDGMFLLADDVADAYTIKRDRKVTLGPGSKLDSRIDKMLKDAVASGMADIDPTTGSIMMKSDVDLEKTRLTNITERGVAGQNMITVGSLTKDKVTDSIKSIHDNVFIKGWNAETGTLQLETRELNQSTVKFGTSSGHRITATIVKRELLDAAGINADMIVEPDDMKKGAHGNMIRSQVDLAVDEIMRQNDEKFKGVTVGDLKKQKALDQDLRTLKKMMDEHFETSDATTVRNGMLIMDHNFGKDGKFMGLHKLDGFLTDFDKKFGTSFRNSNIRYGVEGLARADVYDWEDGVGLVEDNRSGLVRYGYKELDMFEQRANRVLGKGNAVTGWLRDHINDVSKAQNTDRDRFIQGVENALLDITDEDLKEGKVRAGEIVVKTNGSTFHETDLQGKRLIRMNNGVTEVSAHAFNDVPGLTARGQQLTVGDFKGTILDLSGTLNNLNKLTPQGGEANAQLGALLEKNGSVLMELPGQDFSRKYVRLIDTAMMQLGAGDEAQPVLKTLQQSQLKLWRLSKQYQADQSEETKAKVQRELDSYESSLAKIYSSSRDGSIADMRSARLDMSSRFRIQGINSFANNGQYKEGTVYIGEGRAKEMISGAEMDIYKSVNAGDSALMDDYNKRLADLETKHNVHDTSLTEKQKAQALANVRSEMNDAYRQNVLDYMKSDGLYSTVNRYPTISEDALQVLKLQIDDSIDPSHRGGFFTVGTAMRMKADYDGDFFSAVLSHYKYDKNGVDGAAIHQAYSKIHAEDAPRMELVGKRVHADLEDAASEKGVTVGRLMTDPDFAKWREDFNAKWAPKVGDIYDRESGIARMGKSDVGILDNLRYKVSNIASATYGVLESVGIDGYDAGTTITRLQKIQDLGRMFSQEAISSKKFSAEGLIKEYLDANSGATRESHAEQINQYVNQKMDVRDFALAELRDGFANPDEIGRQQIINAGKTLGIFDDPDAVGLRDGWTDENGIVRGATKHDFSVNSMLDEFQNLHKLSGGRYGNWINNRYQQIGVSEGVRNAEELSGLIRGKGDAMVPSPGVEGAAIEETTMRETLDRTSERFKRSVLSNLQNMQGGADVIESSMERSIIQESDNMLSGLTVGERMGARFTNFVDGFSGAFKGVGGGSGAMIGAGMFGAMWAGSALMRSGPTPEGLREQTKGQPQAIDPLSGQAPTARVTQNNGENINIRISAKNAKGMSEQDIAALVHQEVGAMTSMQMNVNMNVNDNTQNINQQWLQGVVANAIDKGYGFG